MPSFLRNRGLALVAALLSATVAAVVLLPRMPAKPSQRAYYFWKTQWSASPEILSSLAKNKINRLYMRFFDVEWDEVSGSPQPVSPLKFQSVPPGGVEVVPVVYIVNSVFLKLPYKDVGTLADNVWMKVAGMAVENGVRFQQFQIDCDWTDSTRRSYFHFAELLNRKLQAENKIVSATIRLHQIKYAERTGIPPVDRGMLMFYNFGRIQADASRSSIFNAEDAGRYSSYIADYPLELDVVLPAFSWSVHSRDGNVQGLLENLSEQEIASYDGFQHVSSNRYSARRSFFFRGRYFMQGDQLLLETTTPEVTKEAALLARRGAGWKKDYGTVALFDLSENHLKKYTEEEIETILDAFN